MKQEAGDSKWLRVKDRNKDLGSVRRPLKLFVLQFLELQMKMPVSDLLAS